MRIMILGGGSNQIDLIKKAKSLGDEVILIDYLPNCPGRLLADKHLLISTFDTDRILEAAKEYHVDAIMTAGTDQPVYSAALVSDELNLSFYADKELALSVTDKIVMKDIFRKNNIPTVDYRLISSDFMDDELSNLNFPIVLKPVDCQGQRGIYKLDNIAKVHEKIDDTLSFSRQDRALVEEYYENDEITVNGWVKDGKLTIISVVDRVTIKKDNHIGICLCHNFPSVHLDRYNEDIKSITNKIVKAFKIENGPIYFQYLIGEDGIKVNEIAMRIGGAYEGITIPIISDIDILKLVLDYVKFGNIEATALNEYSLDDNNRFLSTQLFFCNTGTIDYMTELSEPLSLDCVKAAYYEYKTGDDIKRLTNATARAGYIIIDGTSFADMEKNIDYVFDKLQILDNNGQNLVLKYQDYKEKYIFRSKD